jgi:hypothetical protein
MKLPKPLLSILVVAEQEGGTLPEENVRYELETGSRARKAGVLTEGSGLGTPESPSGFWGRFTGLP